MAAAPTCGGPPRRGSCTLNPKIARLVPRAARIRCVRCRSGPGSRCATARQAHGAGNVEANGRVDTLTVHAKGAGNIDMEELLAHDATIASAGVGNIDVSATGKVDATLSGAGNLSLHRKPAELTSRVNGIGSISQDY